jgi:hypothetical protein
LEELAAVDVRLVDQATAVLERIVESETLS